MFNNVVICRYCKGSVPLRRAWPDIIGPTNLSKSYERFQEFFAKEKKNMYINTLKNPTLGSTKWNTPLIVNLFQNNTKNKKRMPRTCTCLNTHL